MLYFRVFSAPNTRLPKVHTQKQPPEAACNFIKKETLAQVFSCEFCEISKNPSDDFF